MSNSLILKRCNICKALIRIVGNNKGNLKCCGEDMTELIPNSVDAAVEKHVPTYEAIGEHINVCVNHVMEDDHYIEWIAMVSDSKECIKYFKPGEEAKTKFKYVPGSKLYAYCNKHELWTCDVK